MAALFDIETEGRDKNEIAIELGEKALAEFGQQEGTLTFLKRAPKKQQDTRTVAGNRNKKAVTSLRTSNVSQSNLINAKA